VTLVAARRQGGGEKGENICIRVYNSSCSRIVAVCILVVVTVDS
jgi:hypothetical protein